MTIVVTGATGYIGTRLCAALVARPDEGTLGAARHPSEREQFGLGAALRPDEGTLGAARHPSEREQFGLGAALRPHAVRALVRRESAEGLPRSVDVAIGDALKAESVSAALEAGDTLVHLVGTPHPNPSKAREFERVDLASIRASVAAASRKRAAHLVYVSVAHPAPAMHAYVAARATGEAAIVAAALTATILRPWYVLGPGHRWPIVLIPFYAIAERIPSTRDIALRLGLVTVGQMVAALVAAVESPPTSGTQRIVEVPEIRKATPLRG